MAVCCKLFALLADPLLVGRCTTGHIKYQEKPPRSDRPTTVADRFRVGTSTSIAILQLCRLGLSSFPQSSMLPDATIPGPPGYWLIGNLGDIDVDNTMESLCSLMQFG